MPNPDSGQERASREEVVGTQPGEVPELLETWDLEAHCAAQGVAQGGTQAQG